MAAYIWNNIGSGKGLLPDGTKPLSEPLFIHLPRGFWAFSSAESNLIWIAQDITFFLSKVSLKVRLLKLFTNLPGAYKKLNSPCKLALYLSCWCPGNVIVGIPILVRRHLYIKLKCKTFHSTDYNWKYCQPFANHSVEASVGFRELMDRQDRMTDRPMVQATAIPFSPK